MDYGSDFISDVELGEAAERLAAGRFSAMGYIVMTPVDTDNRYRPQFDFTIYNAKTRQILKVEVKRDRQCFDFPCPKTGERRNGTGNVAIELFNDKGGKYSGLTVTDSDLYVYVLGGFYGKEVEVHVLETDKLKRMVIREEYLRKVKGGDFNNMQLALFTYNKFASECKKL